MELRVSYAKGVVQLTESLSWCQPIMTQQHCELVVANLAGVGRCRKTEAHHS